MSQIYNDNIKKPKPKENQLVIVEISPREFMHFAGNSTEGVRSRREGYWGYIPIFENPPKKLPHLSLKSRCNFT